MAFIFAIIYWICGLVNPPGIVNNLIIVDYYPVPQWMALLRSVYFLVVTMTTLGFGDMYDKPGLITGHILLIFQVLSGYVLIAALVTRFAILFMAGGPAGNFINEMKKESE